MTSSDPDVLLRVHCCDKMPKTNNLKGRKAYFAHGFSAWFLWPVAR